MFPSRLTEAFGTIPRLPIPGTVLFRRGNEPSPVECVPTVTLDFVSIAASPRGEALFSLLCSWSFFDAGKEIMEKSAAGVPQGSRAVLVVRFYGLTILFPGRIYTSPKLNRLALFCVSKLSKRLRMSEANDRPISTA